MRHVLRILDANANRAREAIRVMEEAARFSLDDRRLASQLKQLRHDLASTLEPMGRLERTRDTPGDVGTTLTTEREATRASSADVVRAAAKRLSEALRVIEEYAKTLSVESSTHDPAPRIEALRYRGYELERQLNRRLDIGPVRQWRLCLLLSQALCTHQPWQRVLDQAIGGGVDCVQVREKQMTDRALLEHVSAVIERCRGAWREVGQASESRVSVIVNDRADVATLAGADGVHLGQNDLPVAAARQLFDNTASVGALGGQGPAIGEFTTGLATHVNSGLVGLSTTNREQADRAVEAGADYCGVGPMFETTTVSNKPQVAGPTYLRAFVQQHPDTPHLAIGGITPANIAQVVEAGARGVAVSSAICSVADPKAAARQIRRAISDD